MGLIPCDDYEAGANCVRCFGDAAGDPIPCGRVTTPKFILCTFSGIIKCNPANPDGNGSYKISQAGGCIYTDFVGDWEIVYAFSFPIGPALKSFCTLHNRIDTKRYFSGVGPECSTGYEGIQGAGSCSGTVFGHSGQVSISWGPAIGP